ncbi:MAG: C45 family autoproteolytic acyltransferase/hydrolase [Limisphaerales bacterium]
MRSTSLAGRGLLLLLAGLVLATARTADSPKDCFIGGQNGAVPRIETRSAGDAIGGAGYRFTVTNGVARVPVVVVGGSPYQMGWHLGRLMRPEIERFVPAALAGFKQKLGVNEEGLDGVWATTAAYTDDRFEQELLGLAEGSGLALRTLQHVHCLPLLMPYSCSSIAAWGTATEDGHLYQTRNLDWSLEAGAHEFPMLAVYLPSRGTAHVLPTFAGVIGANCGLSAAGIALSEMGDSPAREMPYALRAPHFTTWFRTILYDAGDLTQALELFRQQPRTKRYHFVFGDGRTEKKAVKIRYSSLETSPNDILVWGDNDPRDELAPEVLPGIVYQDEGRGAFPTLKQQHGKLNAEQMISLACQIPIKGGNVLNAVFDATALRLWVSYAGDGEEAYQRPFVFLDLQRLDGDGDGRSDLETGGRDQDGNGRPDFLN